MRIISDLPAQREPASIAQVSYSGGDGFGAVDESQIRGALIFAPKGVSYMPVAGDHLLLMPVAGRRVCAGALTSAQGLMPGELRLASAGGAEILLTQSGDIHLNGVVIKKNGQIVGRGGQVIG